MWCMYYLNLWLIVDIVVEYLLIWNIVDVQPRCCEHNS